MCYHFDAVSWSVLQALDHTELGIRHSETGDDHWPEETSMTRLLALSHPL